MTPARSTVAALAALAWLLIQPAWAIAQPTAEQLRQSAKQMYWSLAVLLVAMIVIVCVGVWLRRRYTRNDDTSELSEPFTLHELRRLHREGQITPEEYERTKALIIGQARVTTPQHEAIPHTEPDDADVEIELGENLVNPEDLPAHLRPGGGSTGDVRRSTDDGPAPPDNTPDVGDANEHGADNDKP